MLNQEMLEQYLIRTLGINQYNRFVSQIGQNTPRNMGLYNYPGTQYPTHPWPPQPTPQHMTHNQMHQPIQQQQHNPMTNPCLRNTTEEQKGYKMKKRKVYVRIELKDTSLDMLGENKLISVNELCDVIKEHFGDNMLEYTPDDIDNFHTDFSYRLAEPKPKVILKNVYISKLNRIEDIELDSIEDDLLYIHDGKCFLGRKEITTDEYNSLTHTNNK